MNADQQASVAKRAKWSRFGAIACFLVFICNVIIGKITLATGQGLAAPLDGPPEFLLLLSAIIFFTIFALCREQVRKSKKETSEQK